MKRIAIITFMLCLISGFVLAERLAKEEEAFLLAAKAFNDGFYDASLGILENFLNDYPDSGKIPEVNLYIGKCYLYQGKFAQAKAKLEEMLAREDSGSIKDALYYWLGEAYFREKDIQQANMYYKRVIEEYPESSYINDAYYALGLGLLESKDFPGAVDNLNILKEKLTDSQEKTAYVNFYLGEAYYYQDKFDTAEVLYKKSIELAPDLKAKSLFNLSLAWDEIKLNKYTEAKEIFEQINFLELNQRNQQVFLLGKGALLAEEKRFENALSLYSDLMNISKDNEILMQASLGKADCLSNLGKYKDALSVYQNMMAGLNLDDLGKKYSDRLFYGLAWANLKNGNFKEAMSEFQKVALDSSDSIVKASALCQIADTYQDEGNFDEASKAYEAILNEFPQGPYIDYARYRWGESLFKLAQYERVSDVLDGFEKDFKDNVLKKDAFCILGKASYSRSQFTEAIEYFTQALDLAPQEEKPGLNFKIGQCYQEQAKVKEALQEYLKITDLYSEANPFFVKALLRIAQIYENSGQLQEAKGIYQRIMSINVKEADYAKEKYAALGN